MSCLVVRHRLLLLRLQHVRLLLQPGHDALDRGLKVLVDDLGALGDSVYAVQVNLLIKVILIWYLSRK